jgi:hypothetical protein
MEGEVFVEPLKKKRNEEGDQTRGGKEKNDQKKRGKEGTKLAVVVVDSRHSRHCSTHSEASSRENGERNG